MHKLVDQDLDPLGVVSQHPSDRRVPVAGAVVVGSEHVDGTVEAALELVGEVENVGGAVGRPPAPFRRANQDSIVVVAVLRRPSPDSAVLFVGVQAGQELVEPAFELAL